jgi:hypothetical protein
MRPRVQEKVQCCQVSSLGDDPETTQARDIGALIRKVRGSASEREQWCHVRLLQLPKVGQSLVYFPEGGGWVYTSPVQRMLWRPEVHEAIVETRNSVYVVRSPRRQQPGRDHQIRRHIGAPSWLCACAEFCL